jgi:hypothetical protein
MSAKNVDERRVLFVCHQATLTGAPIALLRLLEALKRSSRTPFGFLVWVRVPGPLLDKFVDAGIPLICTNEEAHAVRSWSGRKVWGLVKYYVDFLALLLRYRPVVVYSNTSANSMEVIISRALGARTIVHVHEAESMILRLRRRLVWSRPFTTKYVAVSQYVRGVLDKLIHVDSIVVYNGFSPLLAGHIADKRGESADKTLAVIGSICPNKGQLLAVEALASLRASGHRVRLKFIGPPDDTEYVASVERKALESGVERSVDFAGQRDAEEVYEGIDIVLIPSQEETFSLVALEAMAQGVLVIAAKTGGIPEVVQDGKTGLLFKTGSVEDLADRIAIAITHPALVAEITSSARQRVAEAFGIEKTVAGITRVIMDTMGGNKAIHE